MAACPTALFPAINLDVVPANTKTAHGDQRHHHRQRGYVHPPGAPS